MDDKQLFKELEIRFKKREKEGELILIKEIQSSLFSEIDSDDFLKKIISKDENIDENLKMRVYS